MFSISTILSAFNEKGTLLIWLKKLEKALEGAALKAVEVIAQPDGKSVFSFTFDDGTHVDTPPVQVEGAKGEKGDTGATGAKGEKGDTGATGADGKEGNGIDTINDFGHTEENGYTVTTLDVVYTDPAHVPPHERIKVYAKNGENGAAGESGNKWYIGQRVDDIPPTNNGDCYLYLFPNPAHAANGYVYQVINNQWVNVGQLIGKQGEAGTNGTNGKDGNSIISVHTLRHYENAGETITVVEQVTDDGNMQFEVHAANGKVFNHFISFQASDINSNIRFSVTIPICLSSSTPINIFDDIKALLADNLVNCTGDFAENEEKYLITNINISNYYDAFLITVMDTAFNIYIKNVSISGSSIFAEVDTVIGG